MSKRAVNIKIAHKKLEKALKKIERKVPEVSNEGMNLWSLQTLGKFKALRLSGNNGLNRRSGDLARSFKTKIRGHGLKDLEAHFITHSKYARIHEYGGTIKPIKGKYLTIPIRPPGGMKSPISFRKVKSVTIPARMKLKETIGGARKELIKKLSSKFKGLF
jgi:phage gpG-like protein